MNIKNKVHHKRFRTQGNQINRTHIKSHQLQFLHNNMESTNEKVNNMANILHQLDSIRKYIHSPVLYQQLEDCQIKQQTEVLKSYIMLFNQRINDLIIQKRRRRQTSNGNQIQNKKQSVKHNIQTINYRQKIIDSLKHQYSYLQNKLQIYSNPSLLFEIDKQIEHCLQQMKNVKEKINELKKKSAITSQILIGGKKNDQKLYIDLKESFLAHLKKRNAFNSKLQKVQQENQNIFYIRQQIQEQYSKISQNNQIFKEEQINQKQDRHYQLIYDILKRKLSLSLKKSERQEQIQKRRYYNLLKTLEGIVEDSKNRERYRQLIQTKIEYSNLQILRLKNNIFSIQNKKTLEINSSENIGFLLTQFQTEKTQRVSRNYDTIQYENLKQAIRNEKNQVKQFVDKSWILQKKQNNETQQCRKGKDKSSIEQQYSQDFDQ